MYSITLSSPSSLLALYLVAGKAFGVMFRSVRLRLFVMLRAATETCLCQRRIPRHKTRREGREIKLVWLHTPCLVAQKEATRVARLAVDGAHAKG